jgi:hypothetical protein
MEDQAVRAAIANEQGRQRLARSLVLLSVGWTCLVLLSVYDGYLGVSGWFTGTEPVPSLRGFLGLVAVGGGYWAIGILSGLFHWIALRAVGSRSNPLAHPRRRLLLAAVGMTAISVVTVFTMGLFLLPSIVLLFGSAMAFHPGTISKKPA